MINAIRNLVQRIRVNRAAWRPQLSYLSARVLPGVPVAHPQGLAFVAAEGGTGVMLAPNGDPSQAVAVGVGGPPPADGGESPGEGGLHYVGEWKVFLAADGTVHLGEKDPTDWIALASLVDARVQGIINAITSATTTPADGGAVLKSTILAGLVSEGVSVAGVAASVASEKVKAC